jgi:hypothetical protein
MSYYKIYLKNGEIIDDENNKLFEFNNDFVIFSEIFSGRIVSVIHKDNFQYCKSVNDEEN